MLTGVDDKWICVIWIFANGSSATHHQSVRIGWIELVESSRVRNDSMGNSISKDPELV